MKIYISGPITGHDIKEVNKRFEAAEKHLQLQGHRTINPLDNYIPEIPRDWVDYMVLDIAQLMRCEAIYMLTGWETSRGARIEHNIAREMQLKIIYEC